MIFSPFRGSSTKRYWLFEHLRYNEGGASLPAQNDMTFHAAQFDGEAVAWPLLRRLDEGCDGLDRGFLVVSVYRITLGTWADRRVGVWL